MRPPKEPSKQRLQQQFSRALDRWWDAANAGAGGGGHVVGWVLCVPALHAGLLLCNQLMARVGFLKSLGWVSPRRSLTTLG